MGLLAGIAKTAVVAGTSQVTRNAVNRHQAKKNVSAYQKAQSAASIGNAQQVQAPPSAAPAPKEDVVTQLERLGALKNQGILTEEEFQAQKAKILGQ